MKDITTISKIGLGLLPTPFYKLHNISKLTGKQVFIKRDDMTGVALGGNKVRKLEYVLADAAANGCDTIITTGAAQSNHAMLTAACCRRLGLDVLLVLKKSGVTEKKGNLLLNDLMGVEVRFVDSADYDGVYMEMDKIRSILINSGRKPYVIPVGASVPLGSLGYVDCVREMTEQAKRQDIKIDNIVFADGSGGTHAGVLLGAKLFSEGTKVTGIVVSPEKDFQGQVLKIAHGACELLESDIALTREDVIMADYIGPGYSVPSEPGNAAIRLMAENEGIFLDPTYTGKAFAGMLDLNSKGYFKDDETIVFLHTGGAASLFAIQTD